jgi:hypothetical protein
MVHTNLRHFVATALLPIVGACSADLSLNNVTLASKPETMLSQSGWRPFSANQGGLSAADLITPEGQCGAASAEQAASAVGGIALQMSECEVVRRAGPVERFDVATDSRGDRLVVLTYLHGPLPGMYRFTAGRLTGIERAPVSVSAPEVPQKQGGKGKKPAGS